MLRPCTARLSTVAIWVLHPSLPALDAGALQWCLHQGHAGLQARRGADHFWCICERRQHHWRRYASCRPAGLPAADTHMTPCSPKPDELNKWKHPSKGEAPLVHAAAAIAGQLSQPLKMPWIGERLRRCRPLVRIAALFDNEKVSRQEQGQYFCTGHSPHRCRQENAASLWAAGCCFLA